LRCALANAENYANALRPRAEADNGTVEAQQPADVGYIIRPLLKRRPYVTQDCLE
jgi:hypothetical protein